MRRDERGEGKDFLRGAERGSRIEGMRKRWRIETAIVGVWGLAMAEMMGVSCERFLDWISFGTSVEVT